MKTSKITLFLLLTFLITGCDSLVEEFEKGYEKGFRKSFRVSFISSCSKVGEKVNELDQTATYCSCIADELLQNFTVSELNDAEKMKEHIKETTAPKCYATEQADPKIL